MVVGETEITILVSKSEYADDAALVDENAALASTCVTAIATGSMMDAAMLISIKKSKAMHVHGPMRADSTTEADVATLGLSHKCDSCGREFTKQRGLIIRKGELEDLILAGKVQGKKARGGQRLLFLNQVMENTGLTSPRTIWDAARNRTLKIKTS